MGAEHQVNTCGGPLWRTGLAVRAIEQLGTTGDGLPLRAHVQQVDEKVIGQRLRALGQNAMGRAVDVGAKHPQAADQSGHLGGGQGEQLRLVDQQRLG